MQEKLEARGGREKVSKNDPRIPDSDDMRTRTQRTRPANCKPKKSRKGSAQCERSERWEEDVKGDEMCQF